MTLPEDYHTMVGKEALHCPVLKQRISLARSLITQPELLILDNSLSAVDTDTEQRISNYLKSIDNDLTMVIITQRINNIIHYDRIITMSEGRVIENGTHEELLAAKGYYYNLYQKVKQSRLVISWEVKILSLIYNGIFSRELVKT